MKLNYFNFKQFKDKILMTNDFGKYIFVSNEEFQKIISLQIKKNSKLFQNLIEKKCYMMSRILNIHL